MMNTTTESRPRFFLQNTTAAITNPFRRAPSARGMVMVQDSTRSSRTTTSSIRNTNSSVHSAIAGYVAGVSGTIVGYPLDSAKVWIQTGGCKNKYMVMPSHSATSNGLVLAGETSTVLAPSRTLFTVWQTVRALYSGVSGPLLTVGVVQSLNFAVYDRTRQYLHSQSLSPPPGQQGFTTSTHYLTEDSLSGVATAGMVSGMTIACITAPLVMIKTNQQITGNSFRQALQESFYMNGRVNLFAGAAGFLPHVIGESVGRSIYYFAYEGLKRSWASAKAANHGVPPANGSTSATISLQERMVCAAMSGITCWAAIFPLDALRSRLYAAAAVSTQPTDALSQYQSTSSRQLLMDTIRQMRQERSFYRGFWVTVLRAGPVAAAVLPVYDLTLETLASPQH